VCKGSRPPGNLLTPLPRLRTTVLEYITMHVTNKMVCFLYNKVHFSFESKAFLFVRMAANNAKFHSNWKQRIKRKNAHLCWDETMKNDFTAGNNLLSALLSPFTWLCSRKPSKLNTTSTVPTLHKDICKYDGFVNFHGRSRHTDRLRPRGMVKDACSQLPLTCFL